MTNQFEHCKVCGEKAGLYDVVDFNKSCEEERGKFLPLSGIPVYYHRCQKCGFLFTTEFDNWSLRDFEQKIYNDDYESVDPDYKEIRPKNNADLVDKMFGKFKEGIRHIDYGGGNGCLSNVLKLSGWQSQSYDPFIDIGVEVDIFGKHQLITAFEVLEHVPNLGRLIEDFKTLLAENGLILFTTLVSDGAIEPDQRLTWRYASPRNGHISLFSRQSLVTLFLKSGLNFGSFSPYLHVAFKEIPLWAKHIFSNS